MDEMPDDGAEFDASEVGAELDVRSYWDLGPLCLDAAEAHRTGAVRYEADGTVVVADERLGSGPARFRPDRQFPLVRATFDDLNKALSRLANSPLLGGGVTLRERFEAEATTYDAAAIDVYERGAWEPDYGTYVVDAINHALYLVAPEQWHRLALVTSNSALLADPAGLMAWSQARERLESAVVGFAGVSVGGNLLEGWLREARPRRVKVADPDWVEVTNCNRGERMSLRHLAGSRAERDELRNPFDVPRVSKAAYIAYESRLVDPYMVADLYPDGLTRENIERFLLGDGRDEPAVDLLVEEMDDMELKLEVRALCRDYGIDVLMLSDFGHQSHALWNDYSGRGGPLGFGGDDDALRARLDEVKAGSREALFEFIGQLCGQGFEVDQFARWMAGSGEQPTASLPQSGATAMASGGIGGKELALHVLGWQRAKSPRVVYDFLNRSATP